MRENAFGFKTLVSLECRVIVNYQQRGPEEATIRGPYRDVLDLVDMLAQACGLTGTQMLTEFTPSEEAWPRSVSDWTPVRCT